jgi:hypothetical protein
MCVSNLSAGFVVFDSTKHVNCGLPVCALDGSLSTFGFCNGDFVVLH